MPALGVDSSYKSYRSQSRKAAKIEMLLTPLGQRTGFDSGGTIVDFDNLLFWEPRRGGIFVDFDRLLI